MENATHTQIRAAMKAHGAWKKRLKAGCETGRLEVPSATVSLDNVCDFGRWIASIEVDPAVASLSEFQEVKDLHSRFHKAAGEVAAMIEAGDRAGAAGAIETGPFRDLSQKLANALTRLKRVT